jgi:hypothetical protein
MSEFSRKGKQLGKPGRPRGSRVHAATEEQRKYVTLLVAVGTPEAVIAHIVGCSISEFHRAFAVEIETAAARANAKVGETFFKMATSGKDTTATIAWMKMRAGWKETNVVENRRDPTYADTEREALEKRVEEIQRRRTAAAARASAHRGGTVAPGLPDEAGGVVH